MKYINICLISFVMISGCSSSRILNNPNYDGQDFSNKTLLILPINENDVIISNPDDVMDDFEDDDRDPETILTEKVNKSIYRNSIAYLKGIKIFDNSRVQELDSVKLSSNNCTTITKTINKDSIRYSVPKQEVLNSMGIKIDYVLIIDKIDFGRNGNMGATIFVPGVVVPTPSGSIQTGGTFAGDGATEYLANNFSFIIYDYNKQDIVICGKSGVNTRFVFSMSKSVWQNNIANIAGSIFKYSPFDWEGE